MPSQRAETWILMTFDKKGKERLLSDVGGVRPDALMPMVGLESASEGTVFALSVHTDIARALESIDFTSEVVQEYCLVCR